jgi:uncharacterized protein
MDGDHSFRPAWWLPGPHAQTLAGNLLRRRGGVETERERLELEDGDFLDLDWAVSVAGVRPDPGAPLVLVLHGLEGAASSTYVLEMQRALAAVGLASVALNFRSCSGEPNRLPRFYHSGETGDLARALASLGQRLPARRLGAVGFSLGGNVLLKYLGERGAAGERAGVEAAAAVSVPFDLAAGLGKLERGASRLYHRYLLRKLRRKARAKAATLSGRVDLEALLAVRSIRDFDERLTAPLHGFRDSADYYARCSSSQFLASIRVPTLLLHSADDPFLPAAAVPRREVESNQFLEAHFPSRGGHVGFVAGPPWRPHFWAERTAAAFLRRRLG